MTQTLALAHPDNHRKVKCWCNYEELKTGNYKIYVINGAWGGNYNPRDGSLVMDDGETIAAELVWMGEVPSPHNRDYNSAINWLDEQLQKGGESWQHT